MRHSNTGKSDPQSAPVKRGFFAAAGERLKRAMSGARAETADAEALPATATQAAEGAETEEVTTSVQAKARALLTQDRAHKRGRSNAVVESDDVADLEARPRKTSPPPLPWQRTAADANADDVSSESAERTSTAEPSPGTAALEATTGTQPIVARASRAAAKRPVRDSKSKALRERLGAAKAALAEAQAKRAAETDSQTSSTEETDPDATEPEIILEFLDETPSELHAAESAEAAQPAQASAEASQPPAAGLQLSAASTEHTTNVDLQVAAASAPQSADTDLQPAAASAPQSADTDLQPAAASAPQSAGGVETSADHPQLKAASAVQTAILDSQPAAADAEKPKDRPSKPPAAEPIRTLTIARVLARQGYYDRSLSIYDALMKEAPDDSELRAEANRVRADKAGD